MCKRGLGVGLALMAALCLPLFLGCGGDEGAGKGKGKAEEKAKGKAQEKGKAEATKTGEGAKATPAKGSWADQAFDAYVGALKETVALLDKAPAAADALPRLKAVHDKYVDILVPLGKEREAMDAAARTQADAQLRMKMMNLDPELFKSFQKLTMETYPLAKAKTDDEKEFNKLLMGMNTITQYACFELLKKQEPKEAERLGIK